MPTSAASGGNDIQEFQVARSMADMWVVVALERPDPHGDARVRVVRLQA